MSCKGHHCNPLVRGCGDGRARLVEILLSTLSQGPGSDQVRSAFPGKRELILQKVTLRKLHGRLLGSILYKPPFAILMVTFTLGKIYANVSRYFAFPGKPPPQETPAKQNRAVIA